MSDENIAESLVQIFEPITAPKTGTVLVGVATGVRSDGTVNVQTQSGTINAIATSSSLTGGAIVFLADDGNWYAKGTNTPVLVNEQVAWNRKYHRKSIPIRNDYPFKGIFLLTNYGNSAKKDNQLYLTLDRQDPILLFESNNLGYAIGLWMPDQKKDSWLFSYAGIMDLDVYNENPISENYTWVAGVFYKSPTMDNAIKHPIPAWSMHDIFFYGYDEFIGNLVYPSVGKVGSLYYRYQFNNGASPLAVGQDSGEVVTNPSDFSSNLDSGYPPLGDYGTHIRNYSNSRNIRQPQIKRTIQVDTEARQAYATRSGAGFIAIPYTESLDWAYPQAVNQMPLGAGQTPFDTVVFPFQSVFPTSVLDGDSYELDANESGFENHLYNTAPTNDGGIAYNVIGDNGIVSSKHYFLEIAKTDSKGYEGETYVAKNIKLPYKDLVIREYHRSVDKQINASVQNALIQYVKTYDSNQITTLVDTYEAGMNVTYNYTASISDNESYEEKIERVQSTPVLIGDGCCVYRHSNISSQRIYSLEASGSYTLSGNVSHLAEESSYFDGARHGMTPFRPVTTINLQTTDTINYTSENYLYYQGGGGTPIKLRAAPQSFGQITENFQQYTDALDVGSLLNIPFSFTKQARILREVKYEVDADYLHDPVGSGSSFFSDGTVAVADTTTGQQKTIYTTEENPYFEEIIGTQVRILHIKQGKIDRYLARIQSIGSQSESSMGSSSLPSHANTYPVTPSGDSVVKSFRFADETFLFNFNKGKQYSPTSYFSSAYRYDVKMPHILEVSGDFTKAKTVADVNVLIEKKEKDVKYDIFAANWVESEEIVLIYPVQVESYFPINAFNNVNSILEKVNKDGILARVTTVEPYSFGNSTTSGQGYAEVYEIDSQGVVRFVESKKGIYIGDPPGSTFYTNVLYSDKK